MWSSLEPYPPLFRLQSLQELQKERTKLQGKTLGDRCILAGESRLFGRLDSCRRGTGRRIDLPEETSCARRTCCFRILARGYKSSPVTRLGLTVTHGMGTTSTTASPSCAPSSSLPFTEEENISTNRWCEASPSPLLCGFARPAVTLAGWHTNNFVTTDVTRVAQEGYKFQRTFVHGLHCLFVLIWRMRRYFEHRPLPPSTRCRAEVMFTLPGCLPH